MVSFLDRIFNKKGIKAVADYESKMYALAKEIREKVKEKAHPDVVDDKVDMLDKMALFYHHKSFSLLSNNPNAFSLPSLRFWFDNVIKLSTDEYRVSFVNNIFEERLQDYAFKINLHSDISAFVHSIKDKEYDEEKFEKYDAELRDKFVSFVREINPIEFVFMLRAFHKLDYDYPNITLPYKSKYDEGYTEKDTIDFVARYVCDPEHLKWRHSHNSIEGYKFYTDVHQAYAMYMMEFYESLESKGLTLPQKFDY